MSNSIIYFISLVVVTLILILSYRKPFVIHRWQKSLHLKEHARVFYRLYRNTNGFLLSQQARKKNDAMEYVYGEIEFMSFIALLSLINPDEQTIFYDLGSGTGKAVLACGMVFPVQQCVGVEIFPELYFESCKRLEQLDALEAYKEKTKNIKFILADFLEANLNEATILFINSTALFGPTWEKLCSKIEHLPHLKTVITTSKALLNTSYSLVKCTKVEMSWGIVLAYIHVRKTDA